MKVEWKDNSANVGRLELRVRRSDFTGKWNTLVFLGLNQIGSHHEFESDAEARSWCEREAMSIAGPLLDTARAEGADAERALLDAIDAEVSSRIEAQRALLTGLDFEASTVFDIAHATGGVNALEEIRRWVREQMAR